MVEAQECFLTDAASYKELQSYYNSNKSNLVLKNLFAADPERFNKYR